MINKNIFFALIINILLNSISFAQAPSPLKDVKVLTTVTLDATTSIYTYSYSVYNPPINDGKISHFEIDISKPSGAYLLNSAGLIIHRWVKTDGTMFTRSFDEEIARLRKILEKQVIPVGARPPLGHPFPGWTAAIAVMGTVSWGGSDENLILPNQTLGGFILTSYGLPAIRDVLIQPTYIATKEDILQMGVSEDEYIEKTWEVLDKFYKSIAFQGKTIGPTAPPADFKPIPFLDYIISLKHEAFNLGWIVQGRDDDKGKYDDKEKGIMKSLDKKLEKAKAELVKGDTKEAIEKLKSFIHEVEALYKEDKEDKHKREKEGHSHITSEAYALLKYNAIYLIEQLGGK